MTRTVREESAADRAAVYELIVAAFAGTVEARLVDLLRAQARPVVVAAGLQRMRELGAVAVVVLGHPDFYPRFGI